MTREVPESGSALAMRALRRATVYAFAGVGLLSLGIWKAMGVHNVSELFLSYRLGFPVSVLLFSPIHNNDNTAVDTKANKIAFRISQHALRRGGCLVRGRVPGPRGGGGAWSRGDAWSGGCLVRGCLVQGGGGCLVWGVPGLGGSAPRRGYGIPA